MKIMKVIKTLNTRYTNVNKCIKIYMKIMKVIKTLNTRYTNVIEKQVSQILFLKKIITIAFQQSP